LLSKNASLAGDLLASKHGKADNITSGDGLQPLANNAQIQAVSTAEADALKDQLKDARKRAELLKHEKDLVEGEVLQYRLLVGKYEVDLQGLSEAYNNLEQANYRFEKEVEGLRKVLEGKDNFSLETDTADGETPKDTDGEMDDLLACLGQEESKFEKLRGRLEELGEDVDALLEGIGENEGDRED
jgi:chromosome segregation ATPase